MKYIKLYTAIYALSFGNVVHANTYTSTVNLSSTTLQDGDQITVNAGTGSAIIGNTPNTNPINLNGGSISVEHLGNNSSAVVLLSDSLTHNLGIGSKIKLVSSGTTTSRSLISLSNNTSLLAKNLTTENGAINVNNSYLNLEDSTISTDDRYAVYGSNNAEIILKNVNITHNPIAASSTTIINLLGKNTELYNVNITSSAEMAVVFDRGSQQAIAQDLTINHTPSSNTGYAIWAYGDIDVQGNNVNVTTNGVSLVVQGANVEIGGTNSFHSKLNGAIAVQENGISGTDSTLKLSNSLIQSDVAYGIYALGTRSSADLDNVQININNRSTLGYASWAQGGGTMNLHNTRINVANNSANLAVGVLSTGGGKTFMTGSNTINVDANSAALFAQAAEISVKDNLYSVGNIYARQGGTINLELSDSFIDGLISKDATSTVNLIDNGSTWRLKGSSQLNNLSLSEKSVVSFQEYSGFSLLEVDRLSSTAGASGNPLFKMKANMETLTGDFLRINQSSAGTYKVDVANDGSEKTNGTERLDLIGTPDGAANFVTDKKIEKGGYYYSIRRKDGDPNTWEVYATGPVQPNQPQPITSTARAGANIAVASYLMNHIVRQSLVDRLSIARVAHDNQGLWGRIYHGNMDINGLEQLRQSNLNYNGIQFGYDKVQYSKEHGQLLAGLMFGYVKTAQNFSEGKNDLTAYTLGGYGSYFTGNGFYVDTFAKYSLFNMDLNATDTEGTSVRGTDKSHSLMLSAEVGRQIYLGNQNFKNFFIKPNAQFSLSKISGHKLDNSNGLKVYSSPDTSKLARLGFNIGYDFGEQQSNIYAKFDYLREFGGNVRFTLNDNMESIDLKGSWKEFGLGFQTFIKPHQKLFLEARKIRSDKFSENRINVGYRAHF
jgi:outer membrane autotransporter protein